MIVNLKDDYLKNKKLLKMPLDHRIYNYNEVKNSWSYETIGNVLRNVKIYLGSTDWEKIEDDSADEFLQKKFVEFVNNQFFTPGTFLKNDLNASNRDVAVKLMLKAGKDMLNSKDVKDLKAEVMKIIEQILNYCEVMIPDEKKYEILRKKILRWGNDLCRKVEILGPINVKKTFKEEDR